MQLYLHPEWMVSLLFRARARATPRGARARRVCGQVESKLPFFLGERGGHPLGSLSYSPLYGHVHCVFSRVFSVVFSQRSLLTRVNTTCAFLFARIQTLGDGA